MGICVSSIHRIAEGIELQDIDWQKDVDQPDDDEAATSFIDIPPSERTAIHKPEDALEHFTGSSLEAQRRELLKTKVDAFLKVVAEKYGLLPGPHIYSEFVFGENWRALFLKDGLVQVTWKKDSTKYRVLKSLRRAAWIRTHLLPEYTATPVAPPRNRETQAALTVAKNRLPAETVEPADLLQCASDFDTALKTVASDAATSTRNEDALPLRELLGLNEALQRSRGALGDNLARLYQLEADIAQGERELHGEEAANDHEKKRCIQERLSQQRDERTSRLEAAAANRVALRTQFSRIRETIARVLNGRASSYVIP